MRIFVLLLILANLLFFGATQGYFGQSSNDEAARLAQELMPERIRVVARDQAPPAPEKRAEAVALPEAPVLACHAWGKLPESLADEMVPVLTKRSPELMLAREPEEFTVLAYRVRLGNLKSRAQVERKTRELRELGVRDYAVLGGDGTWLVSLGVFSSEASAKQHLSDMQRKKVRSADIDRPEISERGVRLKISGPEADVALAVGELAAKLPEQKGERCTPPVASDEGDDGAADSAARSGKSAESDKGKQARVASRSASARSVFSANRVNPIS